MLREHSVVSIVTLLCLLASGLGSLCPPAGMERMACCDPEKRCEFGIGSPSCCAAAPSSTSPRRLAAVAPSVRSSPGPLLLPAAGGPVPDDALVAQVAFRAGAAWSPPGHGDTVPLFLLNASLLR